VILRSLTARVVVGAMLVVTAVLVGGGLTIVELTQQRDRHDADADMRRFAGNLSPAIAGTLGVPPSRWMGALGAPLGQGGPLLLLDANGRPIQPPATPPPSPPAAAGAPAPGVAGALIDTFNGRGQSSAPAGHIVFVRALDPVSGRHLVLGKVPAGFPPMPTRAGARMVNLHGTSWRLVVVRNGVGVIVEVGALAQTIAARAARLRTIVIWTGAVGLLLVLFGTVLTSRLALAPLRALARKASRVEGPGDLGVRVQEPGQPREVAALAKELDRMLARLQDAGVAREAALLAARRFAADAGHELRTPLQSVRANLEIAASDGANADQRQVALDVAARQSERLNRLVDGLQTLARGESGLVAPAADVDLGDLADAAVFAARTRHPELTIDSDLPASGPVVRGDADGLWRVIENLLENAARHGRPGGHVRLKVAANGRGAEVTVEDDGPGIPHAERERVTGRFARGPGATAAGSGLGLAIVDAEARRHGGGLTLADSALGGLLVRVTIAN
jgi:signal transduction histidine kinase